MAMKICEEHHGQIIYDGMIYLECPLCKCESSGEINEENGKMRECMETISKQLKEFI